MTIAIVFLFTLTGGFFAGLETGLISANQFLLHSPKERKSLSAMATIFLLKKPERLLSTTLIGTNISFVTATIIMSRYLRTTGIAWAPWAGSALLAVFMLIFAEIIPKSFFRQNADTLAVRLAPALAICYFLFFPMGIVLNFLVRVLLLLSGQLRPSTSLMDSKHSLRTLVRLGSLEAGLPLEDQRMVDDIFDFQDTMAREVMIHIHKTLACPDTMPLDEIVRLACASDVRFIPIYQSRVDNLIGFIDLEDLASSSALLVSDFLQNPVYFPDTKRIPDLYREMSERSIEAVFLTNEYGRVTGIVTPAEIVAEIVRIHPGHRDERHIEIEKTGEGQFTVVGVADVENFRNETGIDLPADETYDTVGGFILTRIGHIPAIGESLEAHGAVFTIIDSDKVQIKRIGVRQAASNHSRER